MEKILITIDQELVKKYEKYYFKKYPARKKSYFKTDWKSKRKNPTQMYSVLSLNDLLPMNSRPYKNLKGQWGEFGKWIAKHYKLENKNFEQGLVEMALFSKTRAQKDNDNVVGGGKILHDGMFVGSGMFVDDSYLYIDPLLISCHYDKVHPRLEYRITIFDEKIDCHYDKLEKHIKLWK